jgi:hypothetical protein
MPPDAMAEAMTKQELWKKVHRERVECPGCRKMMSRRAIRWRHVCRGGKPKVVDSIEADARRQKYEGLTLECFLKRQPNS